MAKLLVIDDEPSILHAFRRAFGNDDDEVLTAADGAEGLALVESQRPEAVVLDLNLPDMHGMEVFRNIRRIDARIPVIFVTGHGTTETAIEAMKEGAFDYLLKPLKVAHVRELVERAAEICRLSREPALVADETPPQGRTDVLVGRSPAMQEVYKAIGRVAPQDIAVLILGESGTGKELIARAIYQHSHRSQGAFLAVNCAAIPEALLESELFGHEKGAFTGADRTRIGKFEQCNGGTLFLDEIGDMTALTQAKVLRVLQDGAFERVGGNTTIRSNVRVIAATNRDLPRMAASGEFREDLYYRLGVFTISLPALRSRPEDVPLLVEHFLRRFSPELGKDVYQASPEALEVMSRYPWPGNIRELQSVLKWSLLKAQGPVLLADFLPASVRSGEPRDESPPPLSSTKSEAGLDWDAFIENRLLSDSENLYAESLALMERSLLTRVLRHTDGNQVQAARILGITRGSLRTKIRALGLRIERSVWSHDDQPGP
ncbi:MAG: sigma-54 dependent transcriptional regulator [Paludisphaera borealis]|uniref:sigma-54-dependent transcriptional regulator n=1 Tax=Paludisphaera borealis TaxID=1387353 RepID=UPI00284BA7EF|nr:sigma-54 dependent transcriptional regulator [Paludisphaera borealis]MDR3621078.1 sigma-54 dependent transcriptional regulator [Paludisphaera borealis]